MYIHAPGAGCTGEAKLVKPGDELIFSTSSQWQECDAPLLSDVALKHEEGLASTCPVTSSVHATRPFRLPLPEKDLIELSHKNFSADTMKKI